jgi:hypothetical protein
VREEGFADDADQFRRDGLVHEVQTHYLGAQGLVWQGLDFQACRVRLLREGGL